jgi:spectinomycin phosphotransferase
MRAATGHMLVDWDTVALAPPERDLWWLAGESDDVAAYADLTGRQLDHEAMDFFRLAWDLADLAEYLTVLRSPHVENEDTLDAYEGVTRCMPSRDEWLA